METSPSWVTPSSPSPARPPRLPRCYPAFLSLRAAAGTARAARQSLSLTIPFGSPLNPWQRSVLFLCLRRGSFPRPGSARSRGGSAEPRLPPPGPPGPPGLPGLPGPQHGRGCLWSSQGKSLGPAEGLPLFIKTPRCTSSSCSALLCSLELMRP